MIKKASRTFINIGLGINVIGLAYALYCVLVYKWFNVKLIISLIDYIAVIYYVTAGYKVAHGNVLKYILILFSFNTAAIGLSTRDDAVLLQYCLIFAGLILMHMAGRLNKIKENSALALIALILLVISLFDKPISLTDENNAIIFLTLCGSIVQLLGITAGYHTRYIEHKEAGFVEDNK